MTVPRTARRRPEGRYDPPSRVPARLLAALLSVLFLALVAAVGAAVWDRFSGDRVSARVVTYSVVSDALVRLDLEVRKPAGSRAYCVVRSRGRDGAEVGRDVVAADAEGTSQEVVRVQHRLATTARAVTGEVGRCRAEPIPPPTPAAGLAP